MQSKPFKLLCTIMRKEGLLYDSRYILVEEQVAMFLHVVGRGTSFRDVEERYQPPGAAVFRYFQAVTKALNALIPTYIRLPTMDGPVAISSSSKYSPFLADCIDAVDGTHIGAKVRRKKHLLLEIGKDFCLRMLWLVVI